jgi:hypothetical protein
MGRRVIIKLYKGFLSYVLCRLNISGKVRTMSENYRVILLIGSIEVFRNTFSFLFE